ncbi:MAG TPA: hypothetical protein VHZ24_10570 [Pirellulales bacterium]|jgi:hypothetical protein|nr:hypothetical protein [Pirellulales bacterium]
MSTTLLPEMRVDRRQSPWTSTEAATRPQPAPVPSDRLYYVKVLAMTLVIVGCRGWIADRYTINVPRTDSWEEPELFFVPWAEGRMRWGDFISPHNEHRILWGRLTNVGLVAITGQWDSRVQVFFNLAQVTTTAVVLMLVLPGMLGRQRQNAIVLAVGLFFAIPWCWENSIWGIQGPMYQLGLFFVVANWGLLTRRNFSPGWWTGAACAFVDIFTFGSGFVVGPAIAAVKAWDLCVDRRHWWQHLPSAAIGAAVAVIGYALTHAAGHPEFHAGRLMDYVAAAGRTMSWPCFKHPSLAIVLYLPTVLLCIALVRRRKALSSAEAFAAAFVAWTTLQGLGLAYARGTMVFLSNRYVDIFIYGPLANVVALMVLADTLRERSEGLPRWFRALVVAWGLAFCGGLVHFGKSLPDEMNAFDVWESRRLDASQRLVADESAHFLHDDHVAHLNPTWLEGMMRHPVVMPLLPAELQCPPALVDCEHLDTPFVTDGVPERVGDYLGQTAVGTYGGEGKQAGTPTGTFRSQIIEPRFTYLVLPYSGSPNAPGMSLKMVVEATQETIPIKIKSNAEDGWKVITLRAPSGPFRIVAEDLSAEHWFALAAPRQQSWLSRMCESLFDWSRGMVFAGIGILLLVSGAASRVVDQIVGAVRPKPALVPA